MTQDGEMDTERNSEMDKKRVDCQFFQDQLDALIRGRLPDEGVRHLHLHADSCPECAMQLKVQEHLLGPSLEELEDQVPEELLEGMWDGVSQGLPTRSPFFKGSSRWLVPTLAAACVAFLFSTGFLAMERARLTRDTEALTLQAEALAQQVTEQQRWMAASDLDTSTDPVVRTAALAGRTPFARVLSREETISIHGLRSLLERMPSDRTVLSRAQLDAVLRNRAGLSQPLLREALVGIGTRDGVQAQELIRALESLDVSPGFTVPTADLMKILS
jgi:hypothetical protein